MNLKAILSSLVKTAEKHPQRTAQVNLQGGLTISLVHRIGNAQLSLSRSNTWPSDLELATVRKHYPVPLPEGDVRREQSALGFFLTVFYPLPHPEEAPHAQP
jgi:hypothetical protein